MKKTLGEKMQMAFKKGDMTCSKKQEDIVGLVTVPHLSLGVILHFKHEGELGKIGKQSLPLET